MDDLISKFFQSNLTEAEDKALGEILQSSTEDALRFGEQAEKKYLQYGLPLPHWPGPGGGPASGHSGSSGSGGGSPASPGGLAPHLHHFHWAHLGLKPLLVATVAISTGVGGGLVWHYESKVQSPAAITLPIQTPVVKARVAVVSPKIQVPRAVLTPIDLQTEPHHTFSNLAVVIRRPSPGKVAVRVLDKEGKEAVLLYAGTLKAGSWVFDWNGKLSDGQAAGSGTYQIEVRSGAVTQSKKIVIK